MSRSDDNIDKLFQDVSSGQNHAFDPSFWEQTQHLYKAPVPVPFYTKPLFMASSISAVTVITATGLWFSNSTPENNMAENNPKNNIELVMDTEQGAGNQNDDKAKSTSIVLSNFDTESQKNQIELRNENPIISTDTPNNADLNNVDVNEAAANEITGNPSKIASTNVEKPTIASSKSKPGIKNELSEQSSLNESNTTENYLVNSGLNPASQNGSQNIETSYNLTDEKETTDRNSTGFAAGGSKVVASVFNSGKPLASAGLNNSNQYGENDPFGLSSDFSSENNRSDTEMDVMFMSTKTFSQIKSEEEALSVNLQSKGTLKSLYQPFTLRLSVGNMWSNNLVKNENGIIQNTQNRDLELSLEYHFKPHWGVQIGASYNQVIENQSYYFKEVVDQSFWENQSTVINVQDSTWWLGGWYYYAPHQETVNDTVLVNKFDTVNANIQAENRVQIMEIPVLLTYNLPINRWNIQIASGGSIGVLAQTAGDLLLTEDHVMKKSTSLDLFNSFQFNYLLQTEVVYGLTDHWLMSVRPQLKLNLNSMYQGNSGFNQKYLFYGVNAGIVYRF